MGRVRKPVPLPKRPQLLSRVGPTSGGIVINGRGDWTSCLALDSGTDTLNKRFAVAAGHRTLSKPQRGEGGMSNGDPYRQGPPQPQYPPQPVPFAPQPAQGYPMPPMPGYGQPMPAVIRSRRCRATRSRPWRGIPRCRNRRCRIRRCRNRPTLRLPSRKLFRRRSFPAVRRCPGMLRCHSRLSRCLSPDRCRSQSPSLVRNR